MGKISNLSSYGFNEQPQFDGFINSLKEKADTTEIAEQVKKQESDIKNINDINTKQDEKILGLNVDIKQSGNAFTFTQGGKNLAVINQENGEGSSVIGGSFSNGKLTLNNSNNTSVEIDASSLSFKDDATSIPNLDAYATKQWVEDKKYLTQHQSLDDYAKASEVSGELAKKSNVGHTHQISDITDLQTQLNDYATEQWVENKGYLTSHQSLDDYAKKTDIPNMDGYATKTELSTKQDKGDYALKSDIKPIPSVLSAFNNDVGYLTTHQDLTPYAKKTDIPSLEGYATKQWVTDKNYLTQHQSLEDYYTKSEVDNKFNDFSGVTSTDLTKYYTKVESDGKYATKEEIPSLNGYATEQWVTNKNYLTSHQSLEEYYTKTDSDGKYALKTDIPSLNGYATEQWVTNKGYLTQHQSLEDYYTKTVSDGKYALKTEIQELPKFKTVNGQAITGSTGDITITTDLSNYYKKSETSGATEIRDALAKKQDYNENYVTSDQLANYATTSYVNSELGLKANATDIPTNTIELTFTLTDGTQITKTFYIQL